MQRLLRYFLCWLTGRPVLKYIFIFVNFYLTVSTGQIKATQDDNEEKPETYVPGYGTTGTNTLSA